MLKANSDGVLEKAEAGTREGPVPNIPCATMPTWTWQFLVFMKKLHNLKAYLISWDEYVQQCYKMYVYATQWTST
jgi:hypothetical protein